MGRAARKFKGFFKKVGRGIAKAGKAVGRFALRVAGRAAGAIGAAAGGPAGAAIGGLVQHGANAINDRIRNN